MPKCRSLVIQASTGRRITPNLSIGGQTIPPVEDDYFKFLGMPVRVYKNNEEARFSIQGNLQRMLEAIDTTPLTHQQKLRLFRHGVCPRLSWPLTVEDCPSLGWSESYSHWRPRPSKNGLAWLDRPTSPSSSSQLREVVWLSPLWWTSTKRCRPPVWCSW